MLERVRHWASGWAALARHDAAPGHRPQGWPRRLALECAVIWRALRARGTWGAVLAGAAFGLAMQVIVWQLDLRTWRRDGLLCLPVLLVAPWVAAGRRRHLAHLLSEDGRMTAPDEQGPGGTRA